GELAHQQPPVADRRLETPELDARARNLEWRWRAPREADSAGALQRGDLAAPRAGGIAAAQPRAQLGRSAAHTQLRLVARERAGHFQGRAGNLVATHLEVGELRLDHALRRVPAAAERAARLHAPRELAHELLQVCRLERPGELVGRRAEAAMRARARAAEPRGGIALQQMPAGNSRAAVAREWQPEQRALRDRPAEVDA